MLIFYYNLLKMKSNDGRSLNLILHLTKIEIFPLKNEIYFADVVDAINFQMVIFNWQLRER